MRPLKQIRVERLARWLHRQQGDRDIGERVLRHDHQIGAEPAEADGHAGLDAAHHDNAGEHDGAADRHRRDEQARARLAAAKILQREAAKQPARDGEIPHGASALADWTARIRVDGGAHNVHERVCFICASSVGTITQSWWPPALGRMPIRVSVAVSITAMPVDRRWKPLNGTTTYLPS